MKKFFTYLRNTMALLFFSTGVANSQCPGGQVEVFLNIDTDQWGYEIYWSLTAQGDTCGGTTEVASGGNQFVGCNPAGNNTSVANGSDPGAYANSTTIVEGPFCLNIGQTYTLHILDDWGDGLCSFSSTSQGFSYTPTSAVDSIVFTAQLRPNYDIAAGNSYALPTGWELDWVRPVNNKYYPTNQLTSDETYMGVTVSNFGIQTATNVYAELNIDRQTGPGMFMNVYNDTMQYGTILSDSTAYNIKAITDTTWHTTGVYRYQYIIHMDSSDQSPNSDTLTDFFTLTDGYWSRVDLATNGYPFGDGGYLPGSGGGPISGYEWGSMYYVKSGAGMKLDTMKVSMISRSDAAAASQVVQARIYEVVLQGTGLDMSTDGIWVGLAIDTIPHTIGTSDVLFHPFTNFISIIDGTEFEFKDNTLYYISISQESQAAPFLNDGTTRDGFVIYGQTFNHDFSVLSNSPSYPFYNPLKIVTNLTTTDWYEYGWTGGPEPSIGINMISNVISSTPVAVKTLNNVTISPNPTSDIVNVNVTLENINDVRYVITDASGRLIHIEKSFDVLNEVKSFDMSKYPTGIYMLHIDSEEGTTTKRIIKK